MTLIIWIDQSMRSKVKLSEAFIMFQQTGLACHAAVYPCIYVCMYVCTVRSYEKNKMDDDDDDAV